MINLNDDKYVSPNFTKEKLLEKYSEYDIFRNYIGDFELGQTMNSPLRRDDHIPSFNVFYSKRHHCLLFKDFAGKRGDCVRFVQDLMALPSYQAALEQIVNDMGHVQNYNKFERTEHHVSKAECNIRVKRRGWESRDLDYWNLYGISITTLERFNVIPISAFFLGDIKTNTFDIAYAYLEYKDKILTYKIYRPTADKTKKWRNSHPYGVHSGYTQLPGFGDLLIITKSLKDVMSIYENMRIPAIAVQSETCFIKDTVVDEYKTRFKRVITLFDNDRQGTEQAESYKKLYDIEAIFVPNPYNAKDFSDLIKVAGKSNAVETIKILLG